MANESTTAKVRYKIKGGDSFTIPGCSVKFTNANVNTEAGQQVLALQSKRTGRDYFKLCLEKV